MPRGPQGQKRPADPIDIAIVVAKITTGEAADDTEQLSRQVRSLKAGGKARAVKLSRDECAQIAAHGANTRWRKK